MSKKANPEKDPGAHEREPTGDDKRPEREKPDRGGQGERGGQREENRRDNPRTVPAPK